MQSSTAWYQIKRVTVGYDMWVGGGPFIEVLFVKLAPETDKSYFGFNNCPSEWTERFGSVNRMYELWSRLEPVKVIFTEHDGKTYLTGVMGKSEYEERVMKAKANVRAKPPSEISNRLATYLYVINALIDGLQGNPFDWGAGQREAFTKIAAASGVTLVTKTEAARRGYSLKRGATPVGKGYWGAPLKRRADLYILECHCRLVREQL